MKKIFTYKPLLLVLLLLSMTSNLFAQTIKLNINNQEVQTTIAPIQEAGTTLVPLRVVSENLNASVKWDGATQTVTINKEQTEIKLTLNHTNVLVNGTTKQLAIAPKSINGTTMVPIRFVSDNLDSQVNWDSRSRTVFIHELNQNSSNSTTTVPNEVTSPSNDSDLSNTSTVYVTIKEGTKYHKQNCRYVTNNPSKNISLSSALNDGYEACKVCKP